MPTLIDPETLAGADPARGLEPSPAARARNRARVDALLAGDGEPGRRTARRRPRVAVAVAATLAACTVVAVTLRAGGGDPAEAFAARLSSDGIVHMRLAPERQESAAGERTSPRRDEVWVSLADGRWRLRSRIGGGSVDMAFDGRALTIRDSRTGKATTSTPADPSLLSGSPMTGSVSPLARPLDEIRAGSLRVAGTTAIAGERVYDLVPARAQPEGWAVHWYVTDDGDLRRIVQVVSDTAGPGGHSGPSTLTTDVETYGVLEPSAANRGLLRAGG